MFEAAECLLDATSDTDLVIDVYSIANVAIGGPEHLERCEEIARRLERIAVETGAIEHRRSAAHLRMAVQMQRGDPAVRDTLGTLERAADELRSPSRLFELQSWASAVALIDGDLEAAEQHVDALAGFIDSIGASRVFAHIGACLLPIRLVGGRIAELDGPLRELADQQPEIGAWHAGVAISAVAAGDRTRALASLNTVLADDAAILPRDFTYTAALYTAAEAAAVLGEHDLVTTAIRLLEPWSGRWAFSGTGVVGPIDLQLGRLYRAIGDGASSLSYGRRALAQSERISAPLFVELSAALLDTIAS